VLTYEEIVERQKSLVSSTKARELREESLKDWKAKKSDEQKAFEADISHVARECFRFAKIIETGIESREVDCEEILDASATVTIYRTDTGEIVTQRVASQEELQMGLPL
jgi:hypothetical protein